MLDLLAQKIKPFQTNAEKYHCLREYFQLLILKVMDEQAYFKQLVFMGGTALRILFDIERFSEDLNFIQLQDAQLDFKYLAGKIASELNLMGLSVEVVAKEKNAVAVAQFKFASVLAELGLSNLKDQKVMIKFEVDRRPAEGFVTEYSVLNKEFMLGINHFDKPSLFAGKLHALFCRKYTKGRDYYDLMWFLTKNIKPNLAYLNAGLKQQNFSEQFSDFALVKNRLKSVIEKTNFKTVLNDVLPFLQDPKQARFFDEAIFLSLLNKASW